jgi:hypothetical protein
VSLLKGEIQRQTHIWEENYVQGKGKDQSDVSTCSGTSEIAQMLECQIWHFRKQQKQEGHSHFSWLLSTKVDNTPWGEFYDLPLKKVIRISFRCPPYTWRKGMSLSLKTESRI